MNKTYATIKYQRTKEKQAKEKVMNKTMEFQKKLHEAQFIKDERLKKIQQEKELRERIKIQKVIESNKKLEQKMRRVRQDKEKLALEKTNSLIHQQYVTSEFFDQENQRAKDIDMHAQIRHFVAARNFSDLKRKQELSANASFKEAQRKLSEIENKHKRSLQSSEERRRKQLEKTMGFNSKFNEVRKKLESMCHNRQNVTKHRKNKSHSINITYSQIKGTGSCEYSTTRSPKSMQNKQYQEYIQHRSNIENAKIRKAERYLIERSTRSKEIWDRAREKLLEQKERNRLKRQDQEENMRRIKVFELLQKRKTLERLRIPITAYPHITITY